MRYVPAPVKPDNPRDPLCQMVMAHMETRNENTDAGGAHTETRNENIE